MSAWWSYRREIVEPVVSEHEGRIVKLTGDGFLAEFASATNAVLAAIAMQSEIATRVNDQPKDRRVEFRMGLNLGDILWDDEDIYGDGVNVAARIEALAEPGGILVSSSIQEQVRHHLSVDFEDMGERELKNIDTPVRVYRVIAGAVANDDPSATPTSLKLDEQQIQFCTSSDGVGIAYATVGEGPPLVKAANWLNHLEFDWQSPIWQHMFLELSNGYQLVRYDERGNGLSDWEVDDISFEAFVRDLEAVVDAAELDRFALLGISQGCPVGIAYAVRHPERVSKLVLYGGYARGWAKRSQKDKDRGLATIELMKQGWGQDNPAFRQIFTSQMIPGATAEQMRWFNEIQRITTTPEIAVRLRLAMGEIDVMSLLPQVSIPTLVLHAREDAVAPFEGGRKMAAMIPGAHFVPLESANHLLIENEPAWPRFLAEVKNFLG